MMSSLAQAMLALFIASWCVAAAAFFYGARYWFPLWASGFRKTDSRSDYMRKSLKGFGVFVGAIAVCFAAGGVAEIWGGGW